MGAVQWYFRLPVDTKDKPEGTKDKGASPKDGWDWAQGSPDLRGLRPVRDPKSTAKSKHVPVRAYSMTMGKHLHLESGAEHDLLRIVDRDPRVVMIAAQPFRLQFSKGNSHIPDLLTVSVDEKVTVWDVRPEGGINDKLLRDAELTGAACREVGWDYQLWLGSDLRERLKTLWLTCDRDRPSWADQYVPVLEQETRAPGATVGHLRALDDGSGELTSTMWHLMWSGQIIVAKDVPLQDWTPVMWRRGES